MSAGSTTHCQSAKGSSSAPILAATLAYLCLFSCCFWASIYSDHSAALKPTVTVQKAHCDCSILPISCCIVYTAISPLALFHFVCCLCIVFGMFRDGVMVYGTISSTILTPRLTMVLLLLLAWFEAHSLLSEQ